MSKHMVMLSALVAAFASLAAPFTDGGVTYTPNDEVTRRQPVVTGVNVTGMVESVTYTRAEVDRRIETNAPVRSVNGIRGNVRLGAREVGALPDNRAYLEDDANFVEAVRNVQIRGGGGVDTNAVREIVGPMLDASYPVFSNAVLAVELDTNTVAQIGELKEFFDGLPVGAVGTSLGGIIMALLTAVAWLKKNKRGMTDFDVAGEATGYVISNDIRDFECKLKVSETKWVESADPAEYVQRGVVEFSSSGVGAHAYREYFDGTEWVHDVDFGTNSTAKPTDATFYTSGGDLESTVTTQFSGAQKLARTSATGGIAKLGSDGMLTAASKSSDAEENADYRDPKDAKCYDTKFGEWTFETPPSGYNWLSVGFEDGVWSRRMYDIEEPSSSSLYTWTEDGTSTEAEFVGDATLFFPHKVTATRQRVATKGRTFVTDDVAETKTGSTAKVDAAKEELNARIDVIEATSHPNMSIVGSPTFREGVVSGFSANDYLMFPTNVDVKENAVDFFMAFTTGSNVTTQQNVLDSWCGIAFAVLNGGTVTAASQNGTSFVTATSTGTISANTSYRLKLEFRYSDGSYTVTTKLATGSGEYSQIGGVVTLTAPVHPTATYWGGANPTSGTNHVFGGSINLAECRMDWNGKTVWRGYTEVPTYSKGVRDDGSPADQELHDFFTGSNTALVATIDTLLPYPLNTDGTIKDRCRNVVTSGAFVIPQGFNDLLIRYTGAPTSLTFSGTDADIADWGDDLPTESGDYLITVSRLAASECYIRIIKLTERA